MDAPIRILGLEWDDWAVVSTVIMFILLAWTPAVAVVVAPPVILGLRAVKKGQPPGIMVHRLWAWGIVRLHGFPPPPDRNGSLWSPWP